MESDPSGPGGSGSNLSMRDTRRVLQVLLPTLPPPAIDLALSTVASMTMQHHHRQPVGNFRVRRLDSGMWGEPLDLFHPLTPPSKRFSDSSKLRFEYACAPVAAMEADSSKGSRKRR